MAKRNSPIEDFWASAHAKTLLAQYASTRDAGEHYLTSVRAADFSRCIVNVILPLCREGGAIELYKFYEEIASSLIDVAAHSHKADLNFPPDNGRNLVLDRLDVIEACLKSLTSPANTVEIESASDTIRIDFKKKARAA